MVSVTMKRVPTEKVPIFIEFPSILTEDEKEQAEVMKMQGEMGIVSKATLSAKAGYNWEKEMDRMAKERAMRLADEAEETEMNGEDDDEDEENGNEDS